MKFFFICALCTQQWFFLEHLFYQVDEYIYDTKLHIQIQNVIQKQSINLLANKKEKKEKKNSHKKRNIISYIYTLFYIQTDTYTHTLIHSFTHSITHTNTHTSIYNQFDLQFVFVFILIIHKPHTNHSHTYTFIFAISTTTTTKGMDGGGATDFDLSGNDGNYAIFIFPIRFFCFSCQFFVSLSSDSLSFYGKAQSLMRQRFS